MKVDKEELKALIREEITKALNESAADDYWKTVHLLTKEHDLIRGTGTRDKS